MAEQQAGESTQEKNRPKPWLRRLRIGMMIFGPLALLAIGVVWYLMHRGYVSTEDAFVEAHIVQVSPQVAGRVTVVPVHNNEAVHKGEILLKLDPAPYQAAVRAAEAQVEAERAMIGALKAKYQALGAQITGERAQVAYLVRQVERNSSLAQKNVVTNARFDALKTELARARQQVIALEADRQQVVSQLGGKVGLPLNKNPDYMKAVAQLAQAKLNLGYTVVQAPADGVLGRVEARPGDMLAAGQSAFPLVETKHMWVRANFKETALTDLRPGQKATITVDSYPGHVWHGHVGSISPGSGEIFSLIPPQNATGNWVKVTQRIPVHIDIDNAASGPILRAGMSAEVSVYVGHN